MRHSWICCLVVVAAACGDDGSPSDPDAPPGVTVARIDVGPAALLVAPSDTTPITAQAFDAAGAPIDLQAAELVWTSSRAEAVTVDATGTVTGVALGASYITASADGVVSAPVFVTVAEVAPGVQLVDDAQLVELPRAVNPAITGDLDAELEAVLALPPPSAGTKLLGRQAQPFGGVVVSAAAEGANSRVRMKLVPLPELITGAKLDETFDGDAIAPAFAPELVAAYDIAVTGNRYTFTPKPDARTFTIPPFITCETELPGIPLSLAGLPTMTASIEADYQLVYDTETGKKRLVVVGEASAEVPLDLVVSVDATVSIECKAKLYSKLFKAPGWAGLLLAGEIEGGLGASLEGTLNVANAGLKLSASASSTFELGLDCTGDECDLVRTFTPTAETKVQWVVPNLGQIRIEPTVFAGGYAELKIGATLVEQLRTAAVEARAGAELAASLTVPALQTEPAEDPDYRSGYELQSLAEVGVGKSIDGLLAKLGITKLDALKLTVSTPLGSSPKGTATVDKTTFANGDAVKFTVQLDPATTTFPLVGYNVKRVRILHKRTGQLVPVEVAVVDAAADQVAFDLTWTANVASASAGAKFFAFVETVLPSVVDLEIAEAQPAPSAPGVGACAPPAGRLFCATTLSTGGRSVLDFNNAGTRLETDGVFSVVIDGVSTPLPEGFRAVDLNDANEVLGSFLAQDPDDPDFTVEVIGIFANGTVREVLRQADFQSNRIEPTAINNRGDVLIDTERDATQAEQTQLDRDTMSTVTIMRRNAQTYVRQDYVGPEFHELDASLLFEDGTAFGSDRHHNGNGGGGRLFTLAGPEPHPLPSIGDLKHNARGELVGRAKLVGDPLDEHGYFFANGVTTRLMDPANSLRTIARDISDSSTIVGETTLQNASFTDAILWTSPTSAPLLVSPLVEPAAQVFSISHVNASGLMIAGGRLTATMLDVEMLLVPAARGDVQLGIVAPATATPGAAITYAVNLQNLGPAPANDLRAEFVLPDGFTLVGTTGWQQCETTDSLVVCRAASLAPQEQRAFLVDVKAPTGVGAFTVRARVLSSTVDPAYANNAQLAVTTVAEP